jgi:outer membrane protein TolC
MSERDDQKAAIEAELAEAKARVEHLQEQLAALSGVPDPAPLMPISINGIRYCPVCWQQRGTQQALEDHPDGHGLGHLHCTRCGYTVEIVE